MPCSLALLTAALVGTSFAAHDVLATQQPFTQKHTEDQNQYADEDMQEGQSYQQWNAPNAHNTSAWSPSLNPYQQKYAGTYMDQYVEAYAGQNGAWTPNVRNTSDWRSWREAYMKTYADAYTNFAHQAENLPEGPEKASACKSVQDLDKWRARRTAEIDAFTPVEYQNISKDDLETTFAQRKAEIEANSKNFSAAIVQDAAQLSSPVLLAALFDSNMSAAYHVQGNMAGAERRETQKKAYAGQWLPRVQNVSNPKDWRDAFMNSYARAYMHFISEDEHIARRFPDARAHAHDCKTLKELQQWRAASEARLQAFVPKDYQDSALDHVDKEFVEREAVIKQEQQDGKNAEVPPVTEAVATDLSVLTLSHASLGVPLMMVCVASAIMASTLRRWARKSDGADVYLLHSEGPAVV